MEKIIQISTSENDLFCLTSDGKVYMRKLDCIGTGEDQHGPHKKYRRYWKEVQKIEDFNSNK